ncbi:hypothetical protein WJX81_006259 [Elliptochloris bilobata]|uniref:Peptidase M50 domain-containing protein n=1 Tax=Elliptochloris bilobata TaxID=381761 RepID=A0AAW1QL93_9CHLO
MGLYICTQLRPQSDWEPEVEYEGRTPQSSAPDPPSTSQRGPLESDAIPASIRRRVEDAVEALAARVTAGDVAARAGIRVSEAEVALNALAADTLGTLQVSQQGDVLYVLPANFRSVLLARSWLRRIEPALAAARGAGAYAVRVSFGTALIASVLLVALSVVALLTAASSSDRDNRRGGGNYNRGYSTSGGMGYYRSPFSMWFSPFDLFYYWSPRYPARQRERLERGEGYNFLEGIFSFVFGDGDPNAGYEDARWAMVGQLIQSRGGVVAAEDLAPFLDVTPEALAASREGAFVDEGYVVPALVRFGGQPEVGPDGELLYRFPSLQRTARAQRSPPQPPEHGAALERLWQFSRAGEGQRAGAALLGGANLAGVAYLGSLLGSPGAAYALARNGLGFMLGLFPALQAYAAAFFAIPGLRWLLNARRNAKIEARNEARLAALAQLRAPDARLRRKLANAARQAQRVVISDKDIVYSSDKELAAQPADLEAADFERRLREREARLHPLASLNMLLGVEDDPVEGGSLGKPQPDKAQDGDKLEVGFSPDVLRQIAEAEAARGGKTGESAEKAVGEISGQMAKIAESAQRLAESVDDKQKTEVLRGEFEKLLTLLRPEGGVDKGDLTKIKEQVFGPSVFWVTETRLTDDLNEGGWLVRGNLRAPRDQVFSLVSDGVRKLFGEQYEVMLVPDPEAEEDDPRGGPRIAFQIVPAAAVRPEPSPAWQGLVASVLLLLTLGTAAQLGLVANVSKLPKEILEWLSNPDALQADVLPKFVEEYDAVPYLLSALPIAAAVMGTQVVHEIAHRAVAARRNIKLGPPLFVPNSNIGTFGAVSQIRSLIRSRADLFDLAFAGPAAAAGVSTVLFVAGLVLSSGSVPKEQLLPVPTALFQGSLLLGSVAQAVLGPANSAAAFVHPMLIAGWAGLVGSALNSLPVGSLDGGRMMQAAFGRGALAVSGFCIYVSLALGLLGSALAFPFGIFVVICQRNPEKHIQDMVTPPGDTRQALAAAAVALAVLTLLPMVPGATDAVSSAPPGLFL